MATNRIDSPILHEWDLNENSTRYEYPRGRPDDEVLQIQFSILAFINGLVAIATFVLILAILKSKKLRSNAFNLYLLFMAIPDFIGSFLCLLTCAMSAPISRYYSESMCGFQSFYLVFAFCGNAWTAVVIVYQVHKLLQYSQHRRRYFPPSRQQVFWHVAIVYAYAIIWGLLVAYPPKDMPLGTKLYYGFACFPMEQDITSTWFFYLAFLPGILLLPFLYIMFITGRILWKKMLPPEGSHRSLSIFLMRLILIYFVGWFPFLFMGFVGNFVPLGPWWAWMGAMTSHFQGFISSVVVYKTSKSIRREMKKILWCDCGWEVVRRQSLQLSSREMMMDGVQGHQRKRTSSGAISMGLDSLAELTMSQSLRISGDSSSAQRDDTHDETIEFKSRIQPSLDVLNSDLESTDKDAHDDDDDHDHDHNDQYPDVIHEPDLEDGGEQVMSA